MNIISLGYYYLMANDHLMSFGTLGKVTPLKPHGLICKVELMVVLISDGYLENETKHNALLSVLSYKPRNLGLTGLSRKGFGVDIENLRLARRAGQLDSVCMALNHSQDHDTELVWRGVPHYC